jgi:hypothetical protein
MLSAFTPDLPVPLAVAFIPFVDKAFSTSYKVNSSIVSKTLP